LLATGAFTAETTGGWQTLQLAIPVQIQANTTYVASYHTGGSYYYSYNFFAGPVDNPPLHALMDGTEGGNGVYLYGAGDFPTQSWLAANYWADVVFQPASAGPTPGLTARLEWNANPPEQLIDFYQVFRALGTAPFGSQAYGTVKHQDNQRLFFEDKNLQPGTYRYVVRAISIYAQGSPFSNEVSAVVPPLPSTPMLERPGGR